MEILASLLLNPYITVALSIIIALALILSNTVSISIGKFKIGMSKTKIKDILNISKDYSETYHKYKNNILRNQLSFAEGVIDDLCLDYCTKELIRTYISMSIRENGFEHFDTLGYSRYVGRKIDDIVNILKKEKVESTNFHRDKIAEIFNHALITYNYWTDKIKDLDAKLEKDLASIHK